MRSLIWSLAVLVLALPFCRAQASGAKTGRAQYVGSESCKSCHTKEYTGWKHLPLHDARADRAVSGTEPCTSCHKDKDNA